MRDLMFSFVPKNPFNSSEPSLLAVSILVSLDFLPPPKSAHPGVSLYSFSSPSKKYILLLCIATGNIPAPVSYTHLTLPTTPYV